MKAQHTAILPLLLIGACRGETPLDQDGQGSTTPPYVRAETDNPLLSDTVTPVRVGELGPNFAACNARGTTRERVAGGEAPVRAAQFEQAQQIDQLAPGANFFICSRTHDQRWFGIVYDQGGQASERCGVSSPVPERRTYSGPCATGWVPSSRIRLVAGSPAEVASEPPPTD